MRLQKYEIKIGDKWYPVTGTTVGMKTGWMSWQDADGSTGLSRPGTWREREKKTAAKGPTQ
jgi:hypothetical protein